jgi:hypothetical protein
VEVLLDPLIDPALFDLTPAIRKRKFLETPWLATC